MSATHRKNPHRKKPQLQNVWLPDAFLINEPVKPVIYSLQASHRGDMYHVRAAMLLEPKPLFLTDCRPGSDANSTSSLEDYLCWTARSLGQPYFRVPWDYRTYSGKSAPTSIVGCYFGTPAPWPTGYKEFTPLLTTMRRCSITKISEGQCTRIFAKWVDKDTTAFAFARVQAGMTLFPSPAIENQIRTLLLPILISPDRFGPHRRPNGVLVLHRDSGVKPGGAYPELDTGDALLQILQTVRSASSATPLQPILCGVDSPNSRVVWPSIGTYWTALKDIKARAEYVDNADITSRDIEALFLKMAHQEGYFRMALGFRSGGLDLFTLMGIPTVSISLRNLVGEDRHDVLTLPVFARTNVKYDLPRHRGTAWIASHSHFGPENVLYSPFWEKMDFSKRPPAGAPFGVAADQVRRLDDRTKEEVRERTPGLFFTFDEWVLRVGIDVAMKKLPGVGYVPGTERLVPSLSGESVVDRAYARYCYPIEERGVVERWFRQQEDREKNALDEHAKRAEEMMEGPLTPQDYSVVGYRALAARMWGRIFYEVFLTVLEL
ncbi:hypothetical protein V500_02628 [Pseudogymnoascus sp. VKM F-4518 (FW-2643)]|nr:hypothetical protein V500_02628 [Pseudogymnoascus sp. VKM F-4518 (FW-2643)]